MDIDSIARSIIGAVHPGLLSAFGAAAKYIHEIVASAGEKRFSGVIFLATLFIAFFVGIAMGTFLDDDLRGRDGFLMLGGVIALKLFTIVEKTAEATVVRIMNSFTNRFGPPNDQPPDEGGDKP